MPTNTQHPPDLTHIAHRLDTVEREMTAQRQQYTDVKVNLGQMEVEMRGIREQAKAHNEAHTKATEALRHQLDDTHRSTQTLVSHSALELQAGLDKIISALGIDEDPNAAYTLRYDLKFLGKLRKWREEFWTTVWKTLLCLILAGLGVLLLLGFASYFNLARPPL